jgi:hypothetical protein
VSSPGSADETAEEMEKRLCVARGCLRRAQQMTDMAIACLSLHKNMTGLGGEMRFLVEARHWPWTGDERNISQHDGNAVFIRQGGKP